jgi:hypothetical protein
MGVGGKCIALAALPLGKSPGSHCRGGCVGPRAGLDSYREEKITRLMATLAHTPGGILTPEWSWQPFHVTDSSCVAAHALWFFCVKELHFPHVFVSWCACGCESATSVTIVHILTFILTDLSGSQVCTPFFHTADSSDLSCKLWPTDGEFLLRIHTLHLKT